MIIPANGYVDPIERITQSVLKESKPTSDGWISVKDRLPEKVCIYVLTTYFYPINGERHVGIDYIPFRGWTLIDEEYVLSHNTRVIAWQPLPAPYEGE